jgi:hypothetical protein
MTKGFRVGLAVSATAMSLTLAAPSGHAVPRLPVAAIQHSGNWAGYGDLGGRYNDVVAAWKVPSIPATQGKSDAYFWVGLGGDFGGNPSLLNKYVFGTGLAQIGILEISGDGTADYYPFWEVIPRTDEHARLPSSAPHIFLNSHRQPLSVKPGDFISASASLTRGTYYLKMTDSRGSNNTIWSTRPVPAAGSELSNDSAEVIMEDPTGYPVADFGTASFDGVTIDGRPIGSTGPVEFLLNPDQQGVGVSRIGANGDNFTVSTPQPSTPAPQVPVITSATTYTEGVDVYFDIHYADPGHDAAGFGFVGVNGSGWAEEAHPFTSPSYGIVGPDSIAYPFNEACGTNQQYSSYVEAWIYDTAGAHSTPAVIDLTCSGGNAG